jgi:hypothetical protein
MKVINDPELNETISYLLNNRPPAYDFIYDEEDGSQYKLNVAVKVRNLGLDLMVDAVHSPTGKECHAVYNDSTESWIVSGDMYIPKLIIYAALKKPKLEMESLIPKPKKSTKE